MNSKHTSEEKQNIITAYKQGNAFLCSSPKQESHAARFMHGLPMNEPKILRREQVSHCVNIAAWKTR